MFLAHSAEPKKGILAQCYADHVAGVISRAVLASEDVGRYATKDGDLLQTIVRRAAEYHDLGKLDEDNQKVLSGKVKARHLPVQHTDAGTAYLLNRFGSALSAVLARSHHIGLPDFVDESNRGEAIFRDEKVSPRVDQTLDALLMNHAEACGVFSTDTDCSSEAICGIAPLFFRVALSCLVDGDHADTASHYGEYSADGKHTELRAEERLLALDKYVAGLGNHDDDRSKLRRDMYNACRNASIESAISSCDSPVGTGKTTAVMAHLLTQAKSRGLRRVIVVLPYTNIITQSVDVYRKALLLPGENPEEVVAELHHRADYEDVRSRQLTALWKAPIIVTTAVTFFETLASNSPATLRRLHNLPGSAIFIDESHAALPAKLLPIAWHWIKGFASEWSCYWVLASGSLNRFWKIPEIDEGAPSVPEIVPDALREQLSIYEANRVVYRYKGAPQTAAEVVEWVNSLPGPRIVILNTVQSAAVLAREYARKFGRGVVEHLSTALTPRDRSNTLRRVKSRLQQAHYEKNGDWTLFATSCVEAGVDISFQTGIRELGSLVSLLQTAGRVNRQGDSAEADVWTIRIVETDLLRQNPALKDGAIVLKDLCERGVTIDPSLCTDALKREIRSTGTFYDTLSATEAQMRFPKVEDDFKVIASDTRVVVVDEQLIYRLENYESVNWRDVQLGSVQIWGYRLEELRIPVIRGREHVHKWTYLYDDFLGYMAGILPVLEFEKTTVSIV